MGRYGWGKVSREELFQAIRKAIELGINFFDTADVYGLGEAEENLGNALRKERKKVVIASKFGVRIENGKTFYDNSPSWICKAVEGSLKRLKTDYIDLYQVHYRDGITPIQDIVETLCSLKKKGYIRYFGMSNIRENDLDELGKYKGLFSSFQEEFSLACRKNERDIRRIAGTLKWNLLTWGSLGQGILTGKYDENILFGEDDRRYRDVYVNFHGDKLKKNISLVKKLKEISLEIERPIPAIALRWILDYWNHAVALVGVKNVLQLERNYKCLDWNLSKNLLNELNTLSED